MSVQSAFKFIQLARKPDSPLWDQVQTLGPDTELEELVALGSRANLEFTADELRTAFRQEWAMRWFLHQPRNQS